MSNSIGKEFTRGMHDGVPIGMGYFAVSFSLGIAARNAGMNAVQGFFLSLLNNASAGEYAGIAAIKSGAPYLEIALLILIANARYLLMSCALSQKFSPDMPFIHRLLIGFDVTDELFGIGIAYPGYVRPSYMYGAFFVAMPSWALGTSLGIIAGNMLPAKIVVALSAAIYGMFLAIIIPPARKDKCVLGVVAAGFILSSICNVLPVISEVSEGTRIIILTLIISITAAVLCPIKEQEEA